MSPGVHQQRSAPPEPKPPIQWWIAITLIAIGSANIVFAGFNPSYSHQQRNLTALATLLGIVPLLLIWWGLLSDAPRTWRFAIIGSTFAILAGALSLFRVTGVSGDLLPIVEYRWKPRPDPPPVASPASTTPTISAARPDFPQYLGPGRNAMLDGPRLATNWSTRPPIELWRTNVGPAWSGFVTAGNHAYTQEQSGDNECVTARDILSGTLLWKHQYPGRYATTIAGEGPRATPAIAGDRLFTLGAMGTLSCLDRLTGKPLWSQSLTNLAQCRVPEWGFASSPLCLGDLVLVQAAGRTSVWAFHKEDGRVAWAAGHDGSSYGSLTLLDLDGFPQLLCYGSRSVAALDPKDGRKLWSHPFGTGMPLVANPLRLAPNRIAVSAGYNVGTTVLEITRTATNPTVTSVWSTRRLKCKFGNPVLLNGLIIGLDDGILTALDPGEVRQFWKEGRYGHGQGLGVGDLFLLMAEQGDIVLLQPSRESPGELASFRVFNDKTWNPIALAGDLLLLRNDREAVCLRLPLQDTP